MYLVLALNSKVLRLVSISVLSTLENVCVSVDGMLLFFLQFYSGSRASRNQWPATGGVPEPKTQPYRKFRRLLWVNENIDKHHVLGRNLSSPQ